MVPVLSLRSLVSVLSVLSVAIVTPIPALGPRPRPPGALWGAARDFLRWLGAITLTSTLIALAYIPPIACVVDFPRFLDRTAAALLLAAWLAAPALAWAVLRVGVRTALRLAGRLPDALAPPAFGALLSESGACHLVVLAAGLAAVDALTGEIFHVAERAAHPYRWLAADAAGGVVTLAALLVAMRPIRLWPDRRAARTALLALALVAGANAALAVWAWAGRREVARGDAPRPEERRPTGLRVVLLGLDGASWNILDAMLADGDMPALRKLIAGGMRGDLLSEAPYESPVVWTTIATGRPPAEHGIISYVACLAPGVRFAPPQRFNDPWMFPFQSVVAGLHLAGVATIQPVSRPFRRADTLWEMAEHGGASTHVVNWWCSYPPEPVRGCIATDAYFREWIWMCFPPAGAAPRVLPAGDAAFLDSMCPPPGRYDPKPLRDYADFTAADQAQLALPMKEGEATTSALVHLKWCTAVEENILRAGAALCRRTPVDLAMIVSDVPDTLNHYFALYRWPERFDGVGAESARRYGRIENAIHRHMDGLLAGYAEMADERTVVLLVSDHGFEMLRDNPLSAEAHSPLGILVAAGGPVKKGGSGMRGSVYDVAPTVLYLLGLPAPADLRGRVLTELFDDGFVAAHPPRRGTSR